MCTIRRDRVLDGYQNISFSDKSVYIGKVHQNSDVFMSQEWYILL